MFTALLESAAKHPLFELDTTSQSHEFTFCWCYCGECLSGNKVERVHDRASDVFLL
jgi:hypothetical protein